VIVPAEFASARTEPSASGRYAWTAPLLVLVVLTVPVRAVQERGARAAAGALRRELGALVGERGRDAADGGGDQPPERIVAQRGRRGSRGDRGELAAVIPGVGTGAVAEQVPVGVVGTVGLRCRPRCRGLVRGASTLVVVKLVLDGLARQADAYSSCSPVDDQRAVAR
jgi:hypothetical protein